MHKRVSINQICFLQRTSYLTEYKHGKLCWIAVGSFYQDIDNIMCTMKKGKKTALWHRKVSKTCKAITVMWQLIGSILATIHTDKILSGYSKV